MKKLITILLVLTICFSLFVSCNSDATEGIFSEIAASTGSSKVKIKAYLGTYNSKLYYLADDGIRALGTEDPIISNTSSMSLDYACLSGSALYTVDKNGRMFYYADIEDTSTSDFVCVSGTSEPGTFKGVLSGSLVAWDKDKVYKLSGSVANVEIEDTTEGTGILEINTSIESGSYALINATLKNGKTRLYVLDNGSKTIKTEGIDLPSAKFYTAFQVISASKCIVIGEDKKAYELTSSGLSSSEVFTLVNGFDSKGKASSFVYTKDSVSYMAVKTNGAFDIIKLSDYSVAKETGGFATELRTAEIKNICEAGTPGHFIAATSEGLLYEIDMTKTPTTATRL